MIKTTERVKKKEILQKKNAWKKTGYHTAY